MAVSEQPQFNLENGNGPDMAGAIDEAVFVARQAVDYSELGGSEVWSKESKAVGDETGRVIFENLSRMGVLIDPQVFVQTLNAHETAKEAVTATDVAATALRSVKAVEPILDRPAIEEA